MKQHVVLPSSRFASLKTGFRRATQNSVAIATITTSLCMLPKDRAVAASGPPNSTYFPPSTVVIDSNPTYDVRAAHGDLWPMAWGTDGTGADVVFTAWGDGRGASTSGAAWTDIGAGKLSGDPFNRNMVFTDLNHGGISQVWNGTYKYARKPSGIYYLDGVVYMAVQDLDKLNHQDSAPAATIVQSTNYGLTWTWNPSAPMFGGISDSDPLKYKFTTLWFLDFGKNQANQAYANSQNSDVGTGYVYVYGLDNTWGPRSTTTVPDPYQLFLARVPKSSIMNRSTWQFYTGLVNGHPTWSSDILRKVPVMADNRWEGIGQGGVVYNKPKNRYIFSAFNNACDLMFYDAPTPWGPWTLMKKTEFYGNWNFDQVGGYGVSISSKFISADGNIMWAQSNMFDWGGWGIEHYHPSFRKVSLGSDLVIDPGFENQTSNTVSAPWQVEGVGAGIDRNLGNAHSGVNNASLASSTLDKWTAIKQTITVSKQTNYTLTGWMKNSNNFTNRGYFGIRHSGGGVLKEVNFSGVAGYTKLSLTFNSLENTTMTIFCGFWSTGSPVWIKLDDVSLTATGGAVGNAGKIDMNRDGKEDMLWRNVRTGVNSVWLMNGTIMGSSAPINTVTDTAWRMIDAGDFDADGDPDILWRNFSTGDNSIWIMNGNTYVSSVALPRVSTDWRMAAAGDLNNDGKCDILWRNAVSGANSVWFMNGTTIASQPGLPAVTDLNWKLIDCADFSGDGKADLLWRNSATGANSTWFMNGVTKLADGPLSFVTDLSWKMIGAGDFDNDGKQDIKWHQSTTGATNIWLMNGTTYLRSAAPSGAVTDLNWKMAGGQNNY
jgi:hypothetical protein